MLIGWLRREPTMTKTYNMNNLKGIGGWLVLVAIGVIAGPIHALNNFSEYPSLIAGENFQLIDFSFKAFVWSEAVFFALMILVTVYVAFLFFKKRREFPSWFVGTLTAYIAFTLFDAVYAAWLMPEMPISDSLGIIFGQMIQAAIWIPYMFKSERVRLTFVED